MADTLGYEFDDGLCTVTFDLPGRSTNTITPQVLDDLAEALDAIEREDARAVVFASAKGGAFVSGADLFALREMGEQDVADFIRRGQETFSRIAALKATTVAAINGHCLGGGLELALACDWRLAVDDGAINIGCPETKLGILPAWGGTTRMPRVIGLTRALPLLLGGKTVPPRKARSAGLIDEVVRPERLDAAARRLAERPRKRPRLSLFDRLASRLGFVRSAVLNRARARTESLTNGHYPAPPRVIEVIRRGYEQGIDVGLAAEREAVAELARTEAAGNLMRIFFLRQSAKRDAVGRFDADPVEVNSAAVVGGGTMGAGIAASLAAAGITVRLVEINHDAASAGLRRIRRQLDADVRQKRLSPLEANHAMGRVWPCVDWSGLGRVDLAIEAVAERLDVKLAVFAKLAERTKASAVLATNTSSLSVAQLGEASGRAGRVVGMHFFNPVAKMPLVEIVASPASRPDALATAANVALRIGKVPVHVRDAPGFAVNRVLIPYLAEALLMAAEGRDVARIDGVLERWGMPMGPFTLLDQIGLDVAADIFQQTSGRLGEHVVAPDGFGQVVERGWLGKKSGRGFYRHDMPWWRRGRAVNAGLPAMLKPPASARGGGEPMDDDAIADRLVLVMVNETARLLDANVIDSADTLDLATALGLGWAPFRGGLCRYAESEGIDALAERMNELAGRFGERLAPCEPLRRLADRHDGRGLEALTAAGKSCPPANAPTSRHSIRS